MRPNPLPSRWPGAAAALLGATALAACGGSGPPPIRADTTPAAIAVIAAPRRVGPGDEIRLALKPALPLARLLGLLGRAGGAANPLKGAMEVKEVLVRAPWGEGVRARAEGPLGVYAATLRAPADLPAGEVELEVVASDAAGNVSRRRLPLSVSSHARGPVAQASVAGVAAFASVLVGAFVASALLRRRRKTLPLDRVLRAGSLTSARVSPPFGGLRGDRKRRGGA